MTGKTDFKKEISTYRAPHGRFEIVDVPDLPHATSPAGTGRS